MEAVRDISQRAQSTGLLPAGRAIEETQALVPAADPGSPLPVFSGEQMAEAFRAYRQLQDTLDRAMPDAIMKIQGRAFRKKAYWRAVRTAFNLDVRLVAERRDEHGENWGWLVTYRATAPNGRSADGDGACYASEKPGRGQATEHNVRSHAHSRAFNRAVSNLVGFGEVSAEEADREPRFAGRSSTTTATTATSAPSGEFISDAQRKRLFAIAHEHGWRNEDVAEWLLSIHQIESTKNIPKAKYDEIVAGLSTQNGEAEGGGDELAF